MRILSKVLLSILFSYIFISCTVQENFQFNKDLSGHYSFQFDYSALLEFDTAGTANDEMDKGYIEMEDELKNIEGLSNIIVLSNNEEGKVIVSYDFDNLEALNKANYNKESKRYNKLFVYEGKKLTLKVDFSDELESFKEEGMDDEEMLENIESMIDYTMTFNFENKIKVLSQNNFSQIDDHTIHFKLSKENTLQPSSFTIKMR